MTKPKRPDGKWNRPPHNIIKLWQAKENLAFAITMGYTVFHNNKRTLENYNSVIHHLENAIENLKWLGEKFGELRNSLQEEVNQFKRLSKLLNRNWGNVSELIKITIMLLEVYQTLLYKRIDEINDENEYFGYDSQND